MENEVRKLDASCWNGQIFLDSSEWLVENIKSIDQSVKEMLQLIENDEGSQMENGDNNSNYPNKQPELIARIKEISHRHHLLADHYNKLTGELSSQSKSAKNNEKKTFNPQLTPPFLTPMNKLRMHNLDGQLVASDLSLSSGGGISDVTPNEGSESSLSSDSDSETYYVSPNEHSSSVRSQKMLEHEVVSLRTGFEKQLSISNEKLLSAEEEIAKLKRELENNEKVMVKLGGLEVELLAAKNQIKLHEAETERENGRSLLLQMKIVELEGELEFEKKKVYELQESVEKYTTELSDRDVRIQELNAELEIALGNFALEKWQLEASISKLSERLNFLEAENKELRLQCKLLDDEIKKLQDGKIEIEKEQEASRIIWQDNIEYAKIELSKKTALADALNKNLDGLKLKYDILKAENDGLNAKLQTLVAEQQSQEDHIEDLEHNLQRVEFENKQLISGADSAKKLMDELKLRSDELQKEVHMQEVVISDMAEEKREAIRQLCFSLDYFRFAYEDLRSAYVVRKRPVAVVP
ncbi:Unknown protein [Striga hermonthica]|uniref:NAB domain-containing protein n=1 Tax=Striga hermonthica TaxID=68872 RepID=A0A9N7MN41_STRHE|nr:Unknown protein [Striga hermonthica]